MKKGEPTTGCPRLVWIPIILNLACTVNFMSEKMDRDERKYQEEPSEAHVFHQGSGWGSFGRITPSMPRIMCRNKKPTSMAAKFVCSCKHIEAI